MFANDQALMTVDEEQLHVYTHIDSTQATIARSGTWQSASVRMKSWLSLEDHTSWTSISTAYSYGKVKRRVQVGSIFTEKGKLNLEIETRCHKANDVSYHLASLLNPEIPTKAKFITHYLHTNPHVPVPDMFPKKALERKLVTCERSTWEVRQTWPEDINNKKQVYLRKISPMAHRIANCKWFIHLMRIPSNQPVIWDTLKDT